MKVYNSLIGIQTELKCAKTLFNKFGGYYYRSAEAILESLKPLFIKYSCFITINDSIELIGDRFYVKATATLTHIEDGSCISTSAFAREELTKKGQDASQVTGSTSSYARKYALNGLFCIDDTKDSDATNTHGQQPKEDEQPKQEPTDLQKAYDEISNATTVDHLKAIHKKYSNLKDNKNFMAALTNKKSAINNGI
jgi:hypothetical protein